MNINQMKSELRMENLYFKKYSFDRNSVIIDGDYDISLDKKITKIGDHSYNVELATTISKEDIHMSIVTSADFIYSAQDYANEEIIINSNTVAIMFPFIRSQVTLMTSQPNMAPIVLPTINTQKFQ